MGTPAGLDSFVFKLLIASRKSFLLKAVSYLSLYKSFSLEFVQSGKIPFGLENLFFKKSRICSLRVVEKVKLLFFSFLLVRVGRVFQKILFEPREDSI